MTVKDVVELSAVYLQLEDVLSESAFSSSINATTNPVVTADDLTSRTINLLIRCSDLVLNEIASDFIHLRKTETISSSNNEVNYSSFANSVLKIISVKSNGKKVLFKSYPTFIEVDKMGDLEIEYNFLPSSKTALTDNCDEIGNFVPARTIAYGVASEFCFISGMINEAQMWESKFKNALEELAKIQTRYVKARRWF